MVNKKLVILNTVKKRKLQYFCHVMLNNKFQQFRLVTQTKIHGKRPPGKRRHGSTCVQDLCSVQLSKIQIALTIADLVWEMTP